jgi:hypothetical protein
MRCLRVSTRRSSLRILLFPLLDLLLAKTDPIAEKAKTVETIETADRVAVAAVAVAVRAKAAVVAAVPRVVTMVGTTEIVEVAERGGSAETAETVEIGMIVQITGETKVGKGEVAEVVAGHHRKHNKYHHLPPHLQYSRDPHRSK